MNGYSVKISEKLEKIWSYYSILIDSLPYYVLIVDEEHKIHLANKKLKQILTLSDDEIKGKYCPKLIHGLNSPFIGCPLEDALTKEKDHAEKYYYDKDKKIWMKSNVYRLKFPFKVEKKYFLHYTEDVTYSKKLEQSKFNLQKYHTIQQFSKGIMHDIKNLLTVIMGSLDLIDLTLVSEDNINYLQNAKSALRELVNLNKNFLGRHSNETKEIGCFSLISLIKEEMNLFEFHKNVKINLHHSKDLHINGDKNLISKVLRNLLINSVQAMPDGGEINIYTFATDIGDKNPFLLNKGEYLTIIIEDNGVGIPKHNREKIFVPFFTTKPNGNGLGLSEVYSIIHENGGAIEFESEIGIGTTFTILIPKKFRNTDQLMKNQNDESIKNNFRNKMISALKR